MEKRYDIHKIANNSKRRYARLWVRNYNNKLFFYFFNIMRATITSFVTTSIFFIGVGGRLNIFELHLAR